MRFTKTELVIAGLLSSLSLFVQAQNSSSSRSYAMVRMSPVEQDAATELFNAANQDRAPEGLQPLRRDSALTAAAWQHAQRMVEAGTLSHQLPGEADLIARVQRAGVHCSTVAENIAAAPSASRINNEWMHSQSHRENLLDPRVNAVGIAVVEANGRLFAVQDFAREMTALTRPQQEQQVATLLRSHGLRVEENNPDARGSCDGSPAHFRLRPKLVMRYSTTDLSRLPQQVEQGIGAGSYHRAAVAACTGANENGFSAYQMVILLY